MYFYQMEDPTKCIVFVVPQILHHRYSTIGAIDLRFLELALFGNVDYSSIWGGDVGLVGMQFHDLGTRCEVIVNAIPRFGEAMWGSRAFYPTIWGSDVRLLRMLFTFWAGDMTCYSTIWGN